MEKATDAVSANIFTGVLILGFSSIFFNSLPFLCNFGNFCTILSIFCVLIFHAQSFGSAIFLAFSISDTSVVNIFP